MKNKVQIVLITSISTFVSLLLLFFVGKVLPWSVSNTLRSLCLMLLTWYLISTFHKDKTTTTIVALTIVIARFIANINWVLFGFKDCFAFIPLDCIDLAAIILGVICFYKKKAWICILSVIAILLCQYLYHDVWLIS